jgi:hypothetical protein
MRATTAASLGVTFGWVGIFVALGMGCGGSKSTSDAPFLGSLGGADGSMQFGGSPGSDGAPSGVGGSPPGVDGSLSTAGGSGGTARTGGIDGSSTSSFPANGGASGVGSGGFTGTRADGGADGPMIGADDAGIDSTVGGGGALATGGADSAATGGSSGGNSGGSDAGGPAFAQYKAPRLEFNGETYSKNGVLASLTFHSFVQNTGASGTVTVTVSYQGYTETTQFPVDSGVQYVLGSKFPITPADDMVHTCALSTELPGLTLSRGLGNTSVLPSNSSYGTCDHVSGPSTSYLVPLSSCICSGGCGGTFASQCNNPCGLADDTSGGCSANPDSGS